MQNTYSPAQIAQALLALGTAQGCLPSGNYAGYDLAQVLTNTALSAIGQLCRVHGIALTDRAMNAAARGLITLAPVSTGAGVYELALGRIVQQIVAALTPVVVELEIAAEIAAPVVVEVDIDDAVDFLAAQDLKEVVNPQGEDAALLLVFWARVDAAKFGAAAHPKHWSQRKLATEAQVA